MVGLSGESQNFDGNGSYVRFQPGGGADTVALGTAGSPTGKLVGSVAVPGHRRPAEVPRQAPAVQLERALLQEQDPRTSTGRGRASGRVRGPREDRDPQALARLRGDHRADRDLGRRRGLHPRPPAPHGAGVGAVHRQGLLRRQGRARRPRRRSRRGRGRRSTSRASRSGRSRSVELKDGKAARDAADRAASTAASTRTRTVLLRPKTGLKDMVAELEPGTPDAGRLQDGGVIPVSPDAARRQPRRDPRVARRRHARLPDDPHRRPAPRACAATAAELAQTIRRFEPTALYGRKVFGALAKRQSNIKRVIHNLSLVMDELGAQRRPAGRVRRELERRLRDPRAPGREPARDADASCRPRSTRPSRRWARRSCSPTSSGRRCRRCCPGRARSGRRCATCARS